MPDATGASISLSSYKGRVTVLVFASRQCPASNAYADRISALAKAFSNEERFALVMVDTATAPTDPAAVGDLLSHASLTGLDCPILLDAQGAVARQYQVQHTPTFIVLDGNGEIQYRGSFDDSLDTQKVTVRYCELAVQSLLAGGAVKQDFTQTFGCPLGGSK